MQNVLYERLRAGSTPAQLSHRYNISKARIEAVKKLKDVEREFTRQVSTPILQCQFRLIYLRTHPFYDVTRLVFKTVPTSTMVQKPCMAF